MSNESVPPAGPDTTKGQAKKAIDMMATAATTLRDAISASLPVSQTQLMTVQVPGTIIDPTEYLWNPATTAFTPLDVRIAEAKLVDSQVPISKIMMGRTGKSVARSYLASLDCLVSVESSISATIASGKALNERQVKVRERYEASMKYLTSKDPEIPGSTRLQTYVEKQQVWNAAVEVYNEAQAEQRRIDKAAQLTVEQQRQSFLEWMQANGRDYKATIQAKYMDWVVHGYKFAVEFNFGVVDVSSAMRRIESSKEAFRNLTLLAADGASEYSGVNLTPRNWATLCKQTIDAWGDRNKGPSPIEIRAEIKRLENILISHQALKATAGTDDWLPKLRGPGKGNPKQDLQDSYSKAYDSENKSTEQKDDDQDKDKDKDKQSLTKLFDPKFSTVMAKYDAWNKDQLTQNQHVVNGLKGTQKTEINTYLDACIKKIQAEIDSLKALLNPSNPNSDDKQLLPKARNADGSAIDAAEMKANPELLKDPNIQDKPSPWTRITVKVSQKESDSVKAASESSTSGGGGFGWGWWSVGGGGGSSESKSSAESSMSSLDVELAMDCMLVEIERPWLHAELFADHELDAAPGFRISPGPLALQRAAANHEQIETDYLQFSSYPSAFVIASNVELEFNGDTSYLQSQIEASTTEANVSVGWGPFSVSSSHKSSKSSSKTKAQSTATGMHISLQAPQIIAWVSELLPQLPKPEGGNPALFGFPLAKVN